MIRGLSPFPGAWFERDGVRIKVLGSRVVEGTGAAGVVLDDALHIACGSGAVALTRLQRAGKGAQDVDVFQRGAQIAVGTDLSKG
jgi:methionyl-tRNA formyltransferase